MPLLLTISGVSIPLPGNFRSLIVALLCLYPASSVIHRSGASATLHVLAVFGLVGIVRLMFRPVDRAMLSGYWHQYGVLCIAMMVPLCVNMLSMGYAGELGDSFSTTVQRAAFTVFALFALCMCDQRVLTRIQWGVLSGAVVAAGVLFSTSSAGALRPDPDPQNLLNYTNFIVLLGMFSLYMTGWRLSRFVVTEFALKLLAFVLAVYAVYLSDSRGPLLSMGVLLVFYLLVGMRGVALRWRMGACTAAVLILVVIAFQSDKMVPRLQEAVKATRASVPAMLQGQDPVGGDASTRIRLGLWHASWLMFKEHPWMGDGSQSFSDRLIALNKAGLINDESTWKYRKQEAYSQAHNEVANAMATRGLAGLIAVLLLYGMPLYYFLRQRKYTDHVGRVAADMGILTCAGVILFGLTVTVFTSGWMMAHYVLLISVFIALSRPPEQAGVVPSYHLVKGRLNFPARFPQKALRKGYRAVRGRANRHTAHLWPYVSLTRSPQGDIRSMSVLGYDASLVSVSDAFAGAGPDFHIILSGPSVADIDYSALAGVQAFGVNGSILLQDRVDIDFPFYGLIDRTFVRDRADVVERIVSHDRVLFLTPDVLRYVLQYVPVERIRCRLCLVDDIAEPAFKSRPTSASLTALCQSGADITVFDDQIPLGFSFEPSVGFFDADTIAYTALQIVVWGGAQRVYFHGLDIRGAESSPRFYDEGGKQLGTRLEQNLDTLIEPSFRQAVALLRERGIKVYNLSPNSALGPEVMPFMAWQALADKA